jgi:hypothetical protein
VTAIAVPAAAVKKVVQPHIDQTTDRNPGLLPEMRSCRVNRELV